MRQIPPSLWIAAVAAITIGRLFTLIHHHAVNILYWDQWEFYTPLFEGRSLWTNFTWLHGPQRQGLGQLILLALAEWSGWNVRAEAFAIGVISCLAMVAALWLKRRLFGEWTAADIAIPLLVLTLCQFQIYLGASNVAYGALPCLLLFLYCLAWSRAPHPMAYAAIAGLHFLLAFTGFGLFAAPITLLLLGADLRRQPRKLAPSLALVAAIGAILLFFVDFHLNTAAQPIPGYRPRFWDYPLFVILMFARFVRPETGSPGPLSYLAFAFGLALCLATLASCVWHGREVLRAGSAARISLAAFTLCAFSLSFAASTALGRASMGLNVSQSSRYMSLMIPGFLGLYFHLPALASSRAKRIIPPVFLMLLIPGHLPLHLGDAHPASYFSVNKRNWKACYLQYEDVKRCDAMPDVKTEFHIGLGDASWKLDYLKRNRLNLFQD
jgi:hypothetical protein